MEPPYDESSVPPERRPVIRTLNQFVLARADGRIPADVVTSAGPDYAAGQAVFYIPEENNELRRAMAEVLPEGSYRIVVQPVYGGISFIREAEPTPSPNESR